MVFLLVTTHYRLTGCSIRLRGLWEGDKSGVQPVHRRRFVIDTECWAEGPIKEARLALPKLNRSADCIQPAISPATANAGRREMPTIVQGWRP
jgi:hypothetical protein